MRLQNSPFTDWFGFQPAQLMLFIVVSWKQSLFEVQSRNIKTGRNIIYSSSSIYSLFKSTAHIQVMYNELTLAYLELVVLLIRKPASRGTWKRVLGLTKERRPTSWRLAQTVSASLKPRALGRNLFSWLAAWTDWGCGGDFILIRYELTVGPAWWWS